VHELSEGVLLFSEVIVVEVFLNNLLLVSGMEVAGEEVQGNVGELQCYLIVQLAENVREL
jgi:hypothetical protein